MSYQPEMDRGKCIKCNLEKWLILKFKICESCAFIKVAALPQRKYEVAEDNYKIDKNDNEFINTRK